MDPMPWEELDPAAGTAAARLVLHHAIQVVAAVGEALAPRASDDSQQSLCVRGPRSWVGATVAGGTTRAGIDPSALELVVLDGGDRGARLALAGLTLEDGLAFLAEELCRRGLDGRALALRRHPDVARHPVADGARFPEGGRGDRDRIGALFSGTRGLLAHLAGGREAPQRLWPHRFDLACTVRLGASSVSLGVSPGDGASGAPYWYATESPARRGNPLPALAGGGRWHLEGWVGAELPNRAAGPGRGGAA